MMKAVLGKQAWQRLRQDWKGERLEAEKPARRLRNLGKAPGSCGTEREGEKVTVRNKESGNLGFKGRCHGQI